MNKKFKEFVMWLICYTILGCIFWTLIGITGDISWIVPAIFCNLGQMGSFCSMAQITNGEKNDI